jgi:hypothetical protein
MERDFAQEDAEARCKWMLKHDSSWTHRILVLGALGSVLIFGRVEAVLTWRYQMTTRPPSPRPTWQTTPTGNATSDEDTQGLASWIRRHP